MLIVYFIYPLFLVLRPRDKFSYFMHAGWMPEWIATAKKLIQDEYNHKYCYWDDIRGIQSYTYFASYLITYWYWLRDGNK